ncbi:MAG: glycosyltransferase family 4 protein [Xanthobacteraceae bacterium]
MAAPEQLNILHVMRAPVGGLFRHVVDLARGQTARGHRVGLVADLDSGGAQADAALAALSRDLALGLTRVSMTRDVGMADFAAIGHVAKRAADSNVDVMHGHGAKGGAYVRLVRKTRAARVYTPHGGSLHYRWISPAGCLYLTAETLLKRRTDLFLFESRYARDTFIGKVGESAAPMRVVHNGVTDNEFQPIIAEASATDLVFVGELRALKGVDVLIAALAQLAQRGRRVTATIAGDGPDRAAFEREVSRQGMEAAVRFIGAKPARGAFALGRILVVPSRAESLPYVVLEAAAAGLPVIASNVGGIPEIFGPDADALVPPGDATALADAIAGALQDRGGRHSAALRLKARVRASFSADAMIDAIIGAYREPLAAPHG